MVHTAWSPNYNTHTHKPHTHTPNTHYTHTHTYFIVFARSENLSKPTIPGLSWIWQMIKYSPTASGNSTYCTIAGCKFPPCDFWPVNIGQKFQSLIHSFILSEKYFFYFIFEFYIIVLVLPNIKMNPPQVYMCSPFRKVFFECQLFTRKYEDTGVIVMIVTHLVSALMELTSLAD